MSIDTQAPFQVTQEQAYTEVQNFYAHHFQLLDSGKAEEWAQTFAEDGFFWPQTLPEPVRGRAELTVGVRAEQDRLREAGEQRRHWHGMVAVTPREDGTLHVRCYALIFSTPKGGKPALHMTCVCEDVLVREAGELKVLERRVTRDDLPAA